MKVGTSCVMSVIILCNNQIRSSLDSPQRRFDFLMLFWCYFSEKMSTGMSVHLQRKKKIWESPSIKMIFFFYKSPFVIMKLFLCIIKVYGFHSNNPSITLIS